MSWIKCRSAARRAATVAVTFFVTTALMSAVLFLIPPLSFSAEDETTYTERRMQMVGETIRRRGVKDPRVLQAMEEVRRHLFIKPKRRESAYEDHPLPIGYGQTISQPFIVALMTEFLDLGENDKALEIGTGSGYQAAVLAKILPEVYTLEIIPELGERAMATLSELGYDNVTAQIGDGYYGWKEHAPFDAIIVTAAATHIPPPLVEQLKPGGRMVIPVGPVFHVQYLMLVEKREDGSVTQRQLIPVRFVPLTGDHPSQ